MRKHLSNIWLIVGLAALIVIISMLASYFTCKWHWFGRSGAIMTMMGVFLTARPLIRLGLTEWFRSQSEIDGGRFVATPEDIEADWQTKLDAKVNIIGVVMAVVGTLIWAYGDLIGGFP
jgi:hypothetical protein